MEPKNSLIKQYQELFKLEGAKLTFKDNATERLHKKQFQKNWCKRIKINTRKYIIKNNV